MKVSLGDYLLISITHHGDGRQLLLESLVLEVKKSMGGDGKWLSNELVIEEAQREGFRILSTITRDGNSRVRFLAQDDRSSVLNGEQLASYIDDISRQSVPNEILLESQNWVMRLLVFVMLLLIKTRRPVHIGDIFFSLLNLIGAMVLVSSYGNND